MDNKTILKISSSAAALGLAACALTGVFSGGPLEYKLSSPAVSYQDGTYSAQKENQFSTVRVDMTFQDQKITDCVITSSGDADLLTDDIRSAWSSSIVENQSADTDAITGATLVFSSGSVKEAVEDILAQAAGEKEKVELEPLSDSGDAQTEEVSAPVTVSTDGSRFMRERPSITDNEASETAGSDKAADADPASRFMRERPAFAAAGTADTAESADADDVSRFMREKPAFAAAGTADSDEASDADPASRFMRKRPAFAADETAPVSTDGSRFMREKPELDEAEAAAHADASVSTDGSRFMREKPELAEAEAAAPAEAPVSTDGSRFMRRKPAF